MNTRFKDRGTTGNATLKLHGADSPYAGMWENTATSELFEALPPVDSIFGNAFKSARTHIATKELAGLMARVFIERERAQRADDSANGIRPLGIRHKAASDNSPRVIASYEKPQPTATDARTLGMWRRWAPALYDGDFLSVLQSVVGDTFDPDVFVESCARALVELDVEGRLGLTRDRIDKIVLELVNDKPVLALRTKSRKTGGGGPVGAVDGVRGLYAPGARRAGTFQRSALI